ncbi:MAG: hypothetical protein ACI9DO_002808, partial [Reinekea sp.]
MNTYSNKKTLFCAQTIDESIFSMHYFAHKVIY